MSAPRRRTTAAAGGQPLRDRLLSRPRPSLPYTLLVDPPAAAQARAKLAAAQAEARQAMLQHGESSPAHRRAAKRVADAEAAVEACYATITLTALPTGGPVTMETLAAAHPPTQQQIEAAREARAQAAQRGQDQPPWPEWDEDAFIPAVLAECSDAGMSADEWREFLASHVSDGERRGLWRTVLAVNALERVADPLVLPKGSTRIRS